MTSRINGKQPLEKQFSDALDWQSESLDANTLRQLRLARNRALNQQQSSITHKHKRLWSPGFAMAAILAIILVSGYLSGMFQGQNLSPLDDLDVLTAEAEPEDILQNDFYLWLADTGLGETGQL